MRFLVFLAAFWASAALAQSGLRDTDVRLSKAELTEYLSGQILEFYNDSFATYRADGGYLYNYTAEDQPVPGVYQVLGDSRVCTTFSNGFTRCDHIVRAGERIVMVIANGDRYPVRSRRAE